MRYARWIAAGLLILISSEAFGLVIESPKEGQTIVVGEPFQWLVRPGPREKCASVAGGAPFNKATGRYEWMDVIESGTEDARVLGKRKMYISGEFVNKDDDVDCEDTDVTLNVVLPPTTVVVGINALVENEKDTILKIYRTATGELVPDHEDGEIDSGSRSAGQIDVGGRYSDGIQRGVPDKSQLTYTSTNEKVAIVTPPSEKTGGSTFVTAVGRGVANIIVRYGSFENTLLVKVWECPYETRNEPPSRRGECKR